MTCRVCGVAIAGDGPTCDADCATILRETRAVNLGHEIQTYNEDGSPGVRHYVEGAFDAEQETLDYDSSEGDWIKSGSWDVRTNNHEPVTTLAELIEFLASPAGIKVDTPADQRAAVEHFTTLPAWTPAPYALKAEVYAFLAAG